MKDRILLFFKGVAMGAANVIPGVSGGTIAFITNIYEELIRSLKRFDLRAIQLLIKFRFKEFFNYINLKFLIILFAGVFVSILSLGKLLGFLFANYPVYIWAFFFGLILASVYFVGKSIDRWGIATVISLITGTAIALIIAYLNPASQNESTLYLLICGIVAMASMLLPGLSGSFVLILMGNYQLIFIEAVPDFNMRILLPVAIGSVIGFIILSRIIAWLLGSFRNQTIAILTGFILGSLAIIWPWKNPVYLRDDSGIFILRKGEYIVEGYDWFLPPFFDFDTWIAVFLIIIGIIAVLMIETLAENDTAV